METWFQQKRTLLMMLPSGLEMRYQTKFTVPIVVSGNDRCVYTIFKGKCNHDMDLFDKVTMKNVVIIAGNSTYHKLLLLNHKELKGLIKSK